MAMSSKDVFYHLMREAIQDIRMMSSPVAPIDERRGEQIWNLAYLMHNWPTGLREASSDRDFDEFLAYSWKRCPGPSREWLAAHLRHLGVDPSTLGDMA